ncbi:hemolysin-III related-domain-containing protein [Mycena rebaudengoi]|nr:hemolysin-III related-domain-containing protein [Mycena rebaudengoi]
MATQARRRGRRQRTPAVARRPARGMVKFASPAYALFSLRLLVVSFLQRQVDSLRYIVEAAKGSLKHWTPPVFLKIPTTSSLAESDVSRVLSKSQDGDHLVTYSDLPQRWRNNPFVLSGYRFIPIHRYHTLLSSVFAMHNESLNIHTHLLPLLLWTINFRAADPAERVFTACTLLCLGTSVVWHTMSGCAHRGAMELCARADYVGIGWLISGSIGTIVYYGYNCHPSAGWPFLALCFLTGLAGNILPFMGWFDKYENRFLRLGFFVSLVFSAIAPIAGIAILHSPTEMLRFIVPIFPTLISCVAGMIFYAAHIPERFMSETGRKRLDKFGGGSHAIWHAFIVLAISQWREGLSIMREGVTCAA